MDVIGHTRPPDGGDSAAAAARGQAEPGAPGPTEQDGLRPVSIYDVAAEAGVSYQTVSRVINGHPNVRRSTREVVTAAITRLGYRPNRAARALAGGPVHSVTVLTSNTTLYGQRSVIQGIEEAARAADYATGVRVIESDETAAVTGAVERAAEQGGALIVVAFDLAGTRALAAVPPEVPMVGIIETPPEGEGEGRPWVWIDDREAAAEATRYLLSLGHQTVHYVAIPSSAGVGQRQEGWRSALAAAGVEQPEPILAGWHPRSGYLAGQRLAASPEVSAVLCGNDDLAFGVMRAMQEAGRAVPGSVSVVGFDDIPQAEFYSPALTTVRLDFTGLGRAAFTALQQQFGPAAHQPRPRPELIVRESSGSPPAATPAARRRPPQARRRRS